MQNSKTMVKIFGALRCYEDAKIAKILSLILRSLISLIISRGYGNLQLFTFSFHRHLPWFLFSCTTVLSWLWGERRRILLRGCCWCWTKGKQKNKMIILYHFTTNKILPVWPSQSWTYPDPCLLSTPFPGPLLCARTWDIQKWNNPYLGLEKFAERDR